jgi:glycosyltransferase involved in cell wall biosynthesis
MGTTGNIRPLVSVALCTYNGSAYLREQLDTILQQTYSHIELVVVDDVSTDDTLSILKEYAAKDHRIQLYVNESNLGFNLNFQKAISLCKGEWIAIADQDDIWDKQKIETMLQLWPGDSKFIFSLSGNFHNNNFEGRTPAPNVYYAPIDDTRKLVFNSPVHGHACMFKKQLFAECTPFPNDIFYDWWMSMVAASYGVVGYIPLTLTWHRVHASNSSRLLTSIENETIRKEKLRKQVIFFIDTFYRRYHGKEPERSSLLQYSSLLKACNGKTFQRDMFWYVLKNRSYVFHYKKKPFVILSHLKHAFHMAKDGLL